MAIVLSAWRGKWADAYVFASPFIIAGAAWLIERLGPNPGHKSVSFLSLLLATAVTGLTGWLLFRSGLFRGPALALVAGAVLAIGWLLILLTARLLGRSGRPADPVDGQQPCATCGQPTGLVLAAGSTQQRLCRQHFIEKVRARMEDYHGRFIIVDRDPASHGKQGQYVFYEAEQLLEDSYAESDVQSLERLIALLLPGTGAFAVRIPNDCLKDIGRFDEAPLLRQEPDRITGEPLDRSQLLLYLEEAVAAFDFPGHAFRMDLPHGKTGIYLWHNYL